MKQRSSVLGMVVVVAVLGNMIGGLAVASDACKPVRTVKVCAPVKATPVPACKPVKQLPPPEACKPVKTCERVDGQGKHAATHDRLARLVSHLRLHSTRATVERDVPQPTPSATPSPAPQPHAT
ncbi:MAG: hypothetical protein ABFC77_13170 [Thermoguttaceae bacterium]